MRRGSPHTTPSGVSNHVCRTINRVAALKAVLAFVRTRTDLESPLLDHQSRPWHSQNDPTRMSVRGEACCTVVYISRKQTWSLLPKGTAYIQADHSSSSHTQRRLTSKHQRVLGFALSQSLGTLSSIASVLPACAAYAAEPPDSDFLANVDMLLLFFVQLRKDALNMIAMVNSS